MRCKSTKRPNYVLQVWIFSGIQIPQEHTKLCLPHVLERGKKAELQAHYAKLSTEMQGSISSQDWQAMRNFTKLCFTDRYKRLMKVEGLASKCYKLINEKIKLIAESIQLLYYRNVARSMHSGLSFKPFTLKETQPNHLVLPHDTSKDNKQSKRLILLRDTLPAEFCPGKLVFVVF